jgi:FkbM family methyltransferase
MISYAQNFEDVLLWRALGHVENGFYIDIGAQDPLVDSVSRAFYEHGWRGVHVEPTPAYAQALRDARPDELVVQAAVSDECDLMQFFEIPKTGISTGRPDIARSHEAMSFASRRIEVPCVKLSALLDNHRERDVQWLKIDVEGMELSVLRGWHPSAVRPWIVVVESTLPLSQEQSHDSWEPIVLGLGYRFAYFDGLNRFYVSERHLELLSAFAAPPNVFDEFVMSGTASHAFCRKLNDDIARVHGVLDHLTHAQADLETKHAAELERGAAQRAAEVDDRAREALAGAQQLNQALQRLEHAKDETLQVLRQQAANEAAFAMKLQASHEEEGRLREGLVERERLISEIRVQLVLAQAEAQQQRTELYVQQSRAVETLAAQGTKVGELQSALSHSEARLTALSEELRTLETSQRRASQDHAELHLGLTRQLEHERTLARHWQVLANDLGAGMARLHARPLVRLAARLSGVLSAFAPPLASDSSGLDHANPDDFNSSVTIGSAPAAGPAPISQVDKAMNITQAGQEPQQPPSFPSDAMHRSPAPANAAPAATSIAELLQHDGTRFVQCAYMTLLKRPADPDGLAHYTDSLHLGVSKHEVIRQLRDSREGRSRNVDLAGLQGALQRARLARVLRRVAEAPKSLVRSSTLRSRGALDQLLALHNDEFVRGAYAAVLQRPPDIDGYSFYLNRLQRGTPKWQLLAEMADSEEAKGRERLGGLDALIRAQRRARFPLIGAFARRRTRIEGASAVETRLRAIEQRLLAAPLPGPQRGLGATSIDAIPAAAPARSTEPSGGPTRPQLLLDDDQGVADTTWMVYLEQLIAKRLTEPLRASGLAAPTASLWVCVCGGSDEPDDLWQSTLASLTRLQQASEYPVRIALLASDRPVAGRAEPARRVGAADVSHAGSLQDLAGSIGDGDCVIFLRPGDAVRPELHMALTYFGAFERDMTVFDMYFHEGGRTYPVLLHGFDAVHARAADYFYSRFGMRGSLLREFGASDAIRAPRDLVLAFIGGSKGPEPRSTHMALPLVSVAIMRADINQQKASLIRASIVSPTLKPARGADPAPNVSVVICTKDGAHLLQQLVWRLLREPAVADIVLVSNNSSNVFAIGLLDTLAKSGQITVLRYDQPFNFSAQCNLGAKHARAEKLLFLNDDICPVSEHWLETMLDVLEPAPGRDAIVGPMLIYPDQSVQHAGMFLGFNNVAGHTLRHARLPDRGTSLMLAAPRQLSCLTGAALLMKRHVFECLNGFDPLLATYLQDVDLSLRAQNSGFALVLEPRAILFHMESVSVKPELGNAYMGKVRHSEYAYFARRWGDLVAAGDEWLNPLFDPSDESMRTLRV